MSDRHSEARCCMPPDSCHGYFSPKLSRPTRFSSAVRLLPVARALAPKLMAMRLDDLERQHDVRERRAPRQQRGILKGHADDFQGAVYLLAGNFDAAGARPPQPGHELHQRRLAAAGRSDHGNELPLLDLEVEPFDGKGGAPAAIDQADTTHLQQRAHGPRPTVAQCRERHRARACAPRCCRRPR